MSSRAHSNATKAPSKSQVCRGGRKIVEEADLLSLELGISPIVVSPRTLTIFVTLGCVHGFAAVNNKVLAHSIAGFPRVAANSEARVALARVVAWITPAHWAPVAVFLLEKAMTSNVAPPPFVVDFHQKCNAALPPGRDPYSLATCACLYLSLLMPLARHVKAMKADAERTGHPLSAEEVAKSNYTATVHRACGYEIMFLCVRDLLLDETRKKAPQRNCRAFLRWLCHALVETNEAIWTPGGRLLPN